MQRIHAIEIHEQPGCPPVLRDGLTDVLQLANRWLGVDRVVAAPLAEALARTGDRRVVDLCSGGTGPWLWLQRRLEARLGRPVEVLLTDRFPSLTGRQRVAASGRGTLTYPEAPVDATAVPRGLGGFRTMFNAFHQFQPDEARMILADAVAARRGIAVVETLSRHPLDLVHSLVLPLVVPVLALLARPFSWGRLLFTFVVPVLPLAVAFDAFVSCLRTYDRAELGALVESLGDVGYDWSFGSAWMIPGIARAHWLVGVPREAGARDASASVD